MPTTDTFVIPPMQPSEEPKQEKGEKKKPKTSKILLLVGLVLLIISLPVAIYYITMSPQFAEIRSRATGGGQCDNMSPRPSGSNCFEVNCNAVKTAALCAAKTDDLNIKCCKWYSTVLPTPTPGPSATPTPGLKDLSCLNFLGTPGNCFEVNCHTEKNKAACITKTDDIGTLCCSWSRTPQKPASPFQATNTPTKKPTVKPTNEPTIKPTNEPTTEPTVEPTTEPTTEPTAEPTTAPNTSQCDALCNSDNDCISGLTCSSINGVNLCRNASCPAESSCSCPEVASAPEDTSGDTTGQEMPVSGVGPGILGSITAIGSIILLVLGLAL